MRNFNFETPDQPEFDKWLDTITYKQYIEDHLGFEMVEKLIISGHKGLNKGDYLIDDYNSGKGQEDVKDQR